MSFDVAALLGALILHSGLQNSLRLVVGISLKRQTPTAQTRLKEHTTKMTREQDIFLNFTERKSYLCCISFGEDPRSDSERIQGEVWCFILFIR